MADEPQEDILTPKDTLDPTGVTVASPAPAEPATIDATGGAGLDVPQQQVAVEAAPTDATSNGYDVEEAPPSYSGLKDKSFRKILIIAGGLAGIILLMVGGTLLAQHLRPSSTPKTQASLDQQSVKLQGASSINGVVSPVQAGVPTLQVNGDISAHGSLRLNGATGYAQFSTIGVTGNNTYTLPNASGTICLSSGNCSGIAGTTTVNNTTIVQGSSGSSGSAGVTSLNGGTGAYTIQSGDGTISINNGSGSINLALPQAIDIGSSPTFASISLVGTGYQNGEQICDYGNLCGFNTGSNVIQGGNDFGTTMIVGTTGSNDLSLITNGTEHFRISSTGVISLGNSNVDRLAFNGQISGQDPFVFQGATNDFLTTTLEVIDPTNQNLIKLPNASGIICLDTGNCNGSGNIGNVLSTGNFGINMFLGTNDVHTLTLGTQAQDRITISAAGDTTVLGNLNIGSSSTARLTINSQILGSNLVFQGSTDDAFATTLQFTNPTQNNTVIFPDAGGTVCFVGAGCGSSGGSGDINNGGNNLGDLTIGSNDNNSLSLITHGAPRLTITNTGVSTFLGDLNVNGNTTIGASNSTRLTVTSQILGQDALVFQGASDDGNTTTLRVTNPTGTRVITLPDASGVVCLVGGSCGTAGGGGDVYNGGQPTGALAVGTIGTQNLTLLAGNATRVTISGTTGQATFSGDLQVNGNTTLGDASSDAVSIQAQSLFVPNNLNIDNNTVYIDSTQDMVGFGVQPLLANNTQARVSIVATNNSAGLSVSNGSSAGDILQLVNNTTNVVRVARYGYTTFRNSVDSTGATAFQVQNAAGTNVLAVDTTVKSVTVNNGATSYTQTNSGPPFAAKADYSIGNLSIAIASADFNGDGFADIVSANNGTDTATVSLNDGSGHYLVPGPSNTMSFNGGTNPRGVATGDFNNDGKQDVAIACFSGCKAVGSNTVLGNITVYFGNGNGTFTLGGYYLATGNITPQSLVTGDFNGDGKTDIASSNASAAGGSNLNLTVWYNTGTGSFNTGVIYTAGPSCTGYGIASGLFDADNRPDIVVNCAGQAFIKVYINTGGNFNEVTYNNPLAGNTNRLIAVADIDHDNHPDIVVTNSGAFSPNTGRDIGVYKNNGNGTFANVVGYSSGSSANAYGVALLDVNGDGNTDIAVTNSAAGANASNISILYNSGTGTFTTPPVLLGAANTTRQLLAVDVNHDTFSDNVTPKLDLVADNSVGTSLSVYLNQSGFTTYKNALSVTPTTFADTGLYIQAKSGQLGDLLHVVDSNSAPLLVINATGYLGINNAGPANRLSVNNPLVADSTAQALIATGAAGNKGLVVQGYDSQTANIFEVQGATAGGSSPTVLTSIGATGAALFKNSTDSTTAFQIQNAGASPINLFTVDTTNKYVNIGSTAAADPNLVSFILDGYSGTEPANGTWVNGTMYYSQTLNKFRCYENNAWTNCIGAGGGGGGNITQNGNSFGVNTPVAVGSTDSNAFNLLTNSAVRLSINATGDTFSLQGTTANTGTGLPTTISGGGGTTTGGALTIAGGAATVSGTGGALTLQGGAGVTGGNVVISAGVGSGGTNGSINIGTVNNISTINIANAATTVAGGRTVNIAATAPTGSGTQLITIGNATATTTSIQGSTLTVGATTSTTNIQGTTLSLTTNAGGTVNVGAGTTTGTVNLGSAVTTGAINIGTSTGTGGNITIGGTSQSGASAIILGQSTATNTISIGSAITGSGNTQTINIGNGAGAGTAINVSILSGSGTAGTGTLKLGNNQQVTTIDIGNIGPAAARTITVGGGNTAVADTINIGTGTAIANGSKVVHIADGTSSGTGFTAVTIGSNRASTSTVTTIQGGSNSTTGSIVLQTAANGKIQLGAQSLTSNVVQVGSGATSDAVSTLFILDSYSNGTDPTAVEGAMYYNSSSHKFRCAQGAVATWTNCVGGGGAGTGDVNNGGNNYGNTNPMSLGTINGADLNLITNSSTRLTITSGGFVGINNSSPAGLFRVNTPTTPDVNATVLFATGGDSSKGLVIQANSGTQTANLQEWQASTSNTVLASVSATGVGSFANLLQNGNQVCDTNNIGSGGACAATLQTAYNNSTSPEIVLGSGATKGITIRDNATPIGANLLEVQNNAGNIAYFKVDANGIGVTGSATISNGISLTGGNLNISTGKLQVNSLDVISNAGVLTNVTYQGGTVAVAYGGTGSTSFTSNGILFGNGLGGIQATAAGTTGQCLTATTGAAPTWGTCTPGSSGTVNDGGNNFGHDATIGSSSALWGLGLLSGGSQVARFSNTGQATFQNITDSTTAFQVQNQGNVSLFNIDSANSIVYIGSPTPDNVGTLLVLDTKTGSGDPTGVNGAMYYNSSAGKFRCYEAGSWKDCIYSQQTSTKGSDQTVTSTSYGDVSGLNFAVVAGNTYRLQCTLLLSVPVGTNGGNLSTNGPGSPTQYTATFAKSIDSSSGDTYATSSTYDDTSSATAFKINTVSTGSNRFIVNYSAILVNGGSSGTWSVRAKAVDGSSSITFYANSSCNLQPL